MSESFDLLIVGVGGQGTVLASNIIGESCLIEKRSVRSAETHGMAQRGGSVETHIRIDGKYGSLISPGTADLIISFDLLEALRYSHFLKKGGKIISSSGIIVPVSAFQQNLEIPTPEELIERMSGFDLTVIDAEKIAGEAGSLLSQNVVMLGASASALPLKVESMTEAVQSLVPPKTVEINTRAFEYGFKAAQNNIS
ncbi:indolepyruvate oxidoreductase subunit beta [Methanoplanus endosymbiosus]|uniref:Indolepyruvate oxidoreductase subunit beta n=1 Tax=Methanoplanus endosymbiosus TaxID=33865 RepID=A0A9E7PJY4_9EURY|nr:indolepyruvate oxidoreductase subunit beta [Methanoplanus endosymbiosus]UUX91355.1 indolepyruvate oxidoreductase subunit beta [Methanoplanus endosymbiosus]